VTSAARIRAALQQTHARPAIAQGIRAAVVTVTPLVIGVATGHGLEYTWVALGAFQASLADSGGPYRVRAVSMSAVVLGGTLAVFVGSLASRWALAAVPLAFLAAFVSGMVRVYGTAGAVVGVNNLVMTLLGLAYPIRGLGVVTHRAEYFFAGAALSAAAALVLWPFQPNNPARYAMADCFDQLAAQFRVLASMPGAPDAGSDAWHDLPVETHAAARAAIEAARDQVAAVRLARDGEMRRGEQLLALLVVAERLFGLTHSVPDLMMAAGVAAPGPEADRVRAMLGNVAARLARVAALVRPNVPAPAAPSVAFGTADAAGLPTMRQILEEVAIAEPVAEALARGAPMPDLARTVLEVAREFMPPRTGTLQAIVVPLRDNWGFQSIAFQHAVRLAVGVGAAEAVAIGTGLPRGYWLTVTTGIILQPYAGATLERAIQRITGTVAGVLIAALLTVLLHAPLALTLVLFPLTALTFALRPISYWYFTLFLTPIFVLLAEGLRGDPHLVAYRLLNTVLGGALAAITSALVFPVWEREGLGAALAKAVAADREYVRAVLGESSTPEPAARRAMGLANGNAEVAVQRIAGEGQRSQEMFLAGTTIVAVLRRLGGALSAIAVMREARPDAAREEDASRLGPCIETALRELAASLDEGREPGPVPVCPTVDATRVPLAPLFVRQVEVLHGAVARFEAARPS
jgi:uncharacterized membrane protein YccC